MPPAGGPRRRHTETGDVVLTPPPASFAALDPIVEPLREGTRVHRVYAPQPYRTQALTFRDHGPHARFDHHRRGPDGKPRRDPDRRVMYVGAGLICCLGEFFADSDEIMLPGTRVAVLRCTRDLRVLDLRRTAATGVGTTQAMSSIGQRRLSQAWSRYLYEHPELGDIHGLLYTAASSGHDAIALYERAEGAFRVALDLDLGDPSIEPDVQLAAAALHWPLAR